MNPSHVVPLSGERNERTSFFPFVLVSVGPVPPGHLTAAGHVTVLAVPSIVKISVKALTVFDDESTFEIVSVVMFAFSETSKTCASLRLSVSVPLEIVGAVYGSV